jgi:5-methylcytosine-specific restriction endonuclease McrA
MSKRRSYKHIKAQKEVKEQEGYMCLLCGEVFSNAHGHHLMYYSEGGSATFHSMTTLCPTCHQRYHSGKARPDIIRF